MVARSDSFTVRKAGKPMPRSIRQWAVSPSAGLGEASGQVARIWGEQAHHGQRVGFLPGGAFLAVGPQAHVLVGSDERSHGIPTDEQNRRGVFPPPRESTDEQALYICRSAEAQRRMHGSQERHGSGFPLLKKAANADFNKDTNAPNEHYGL